MKISKLHITYVYIAFLILILLIVIFITNTGKIDKSDGDINTEVVTEYPQDINSLQPIVRYTDEKGNVYWVGMSSELNNTYRLENKNIIGTSRLEVTSATLMQLELSTNDMNKEEVKSFDNTLDTSGITYQSINDSERYIVGLLKSGFTIYKKLEMPHYCDLVLKNKNNYLRIIVTQDKMIENIISIEVVNNTDYIDKYIK